MSNGITMERSSLPLRDKLALALLNEEFADTTFTVGPERSVIKCHRLMLTCQSPVLYAMCNRQLSYDGEFEFELPDIQPNIFIKFLKFLYTEDLQITVEQVIPVCALARLYDIDTLVQKCKFALKIELNAKNAVWALQEVQSQSDFDMEKIVLDFIFENATGVFNSQFFNYLSYSNLNNILRSDLLMINEFCLFNAVYSWAEHKCLQDSDQKPLPKNIRTKLNLAFYSVRYPLMTAEEFIIQVCKKGILSAKETFDILSLICLPASPAKQELEKKSVFWVQPRRIHQYAVQRFKKRTNWLHNYNDKRWAHSFMASEDIQIVSIGFFGPPDQPLAKYDIRVEIMNEEMTMPLGKAAIDQEFKIIEGVFHVPFDSPVPIEKKVWYTITFFIIKGNPTHGGSDEDYKTLVEVNCHNSRAIKFEFRPAMEDNTDFQIAEIYFQLLP